MANDTIQTRLNRLDQSPRPRSFKERQVEMVYWYCKFAPQEETEIGLRERVATVMGVSVTTVYNHLSSIQDKLEIAELRYVPDEVCRALVPVIDELPTEHRTLEDKDKEGKVIGTEVVLVPSFRKLVWPRAETLEDEAINRLFAGASTQAPLGDDNSEARSQDATVETPDAIEELLGELERTNEAEDTGVAIGVVAAQAGGQQFDAIGRQLESNDSGTQTNSSAQSQRSTTGSTAQAQPESGRNWWIALLPLLLIAGMLFGGISWLRGRNQPEEQLAAADRELINQLVAATVQAMPPIIQTQIVREIVEVTIPAEIIEQTRLVEVLATVPVIQTRIVEQTVVAEVPVTVEVTPQPTVTPTVTPLPQNITITEDFSDFSLDPAFEVEGEPQFAEGRLNAPSMVTIKLGDETWKNYTIRFYGRSLSPDGSYNGVFRTPFEMTVRDNRTSKLRYNGSWSYLNDSGEFVGLIGTDIGWRWGVEIVIEDDLIYFTDSDGNTKTIPNTYSDSGGFTISLGNAYLDDLVVIRND